MSRVGKKPVVIPSGVTAKVEGQHVAVKGAKGELRFTAPDAVSVKLEVVGVTKGFEKKLEINGVGYKAAVAGKNLQLSLGYSHDVIFPIPAGVTITAAKPTEITVAGIDKQQVGQVAAEIREFRRPEPYKGKGVKYAGEFIFRKEGKKK
jgi:large subunit ribosomal protein L6